MSKCLLIAGNEKDLQYVLNAIFKHCDAQQEDFSIKKIPGENQSGLYYAGTGMESVFYAGYATAYYQALLDR